MTPDRNRVVVHVSHVHPAFDTRIFAKEACALARHGFTVHLISNANATGIISGVHMHGLPPYGNRLRRMSSHAIHALIEAIGTHAPIVHFHDSEFIPAAIVLKLMGRKIIYDVHEDLPAAILDKRWLPRSLRKPVSRIAAIAEWIAATLFDRIVAATPSIAARFPGEKTYIVQNFPFPAELHAGDQSQTATRTRNVAYVGMLSPERGAIEMVRAMSLVDPKLGSILSIAGDASPSSLVADMQAAPGWDRIQMLGKVDRAGVRKLLSEACAGLVLFHPLANHIDAQPNKLFEYMSASLPVIASDFPLWRRIVGGAECGILVDPLDPSAIARAIEWLCQHPLEARQMGRKGREAVLAEFNWAKEEKKLVQMYESLLPAAE